MLRASTAETHPERLLLRVPQICSWPAGQAASGALPDRWAAQARWAARSAWACWAMKCPGLRPIACGWALLPAQEASVEQPQPEMAPVQSETVLLSNPLSGRAATYISGMGQQQ